MEFYYLSDQEYQHKRALWPFLKRIFSCSLQHRKTFWLMVASSCIIAAVDAIFPLLWLSYIDDWITPAIEQYQAGGEQLALIPELIRYGGLFLGLFFVQALAVAGFIFYAGRLGEFVIFDLREAMFRKLQYLSHSFYDRTSIGHLSIRLTSDVHKVTNVIAFGFADLIFGIIMILASLVAMFWYNWRLASIVLLSIPVLLLLAIRVRVFLLGYARKARRAYSQMTANLTENLNGLLVNKTTVQEKAATGRFGKVSRQLRNASYRAAVYHSLYNPIVVVTGSLAAALVVYMGGHMALNQHTGVTIGMLAAFFGYARLIFEPIFDITSYYARAQDSLSAGERIFSLIDEPITIKDVAGVKPFGPLKGEIRFEQVHFHYVPGKPILQHFNLHIPAGQSVAIVGATGSGKTTISKLICRFYEPQQGRILIDGQDYRSRSLGSFRSQLGIILQTPHLFSGSLRDNLRYGRLDATDEEIRQALTLIGAEAFAHRLDEEVGEEGSNFSLGERQLISFARCMLKDPRILIMDEATSSVDALAEADIQRGTEKLVSGRTAIIIAHRLSTIRHCDRILLIEAGRIAEDGSHEELLALGGQYARLYAGQARG